MRLYLLVLLAAACNSGPLTAEPSMQAARCDADAQLPAGAQIVSCGFSPHLELIGVDGDALYAMTEGGQLYRIDKRSGNKTLLYLQTSPLVDGLGQKLHLAGGRLFFRAAGALVSVDAAAPSSPQSVLAAAELGGDPLITDDAIFWLRAHTEPGLVQYLDVRRSPLAGGAGQVLYPSYAWPIAAGGGRVYLTTLLDGSSIFPPFPQLLQVAALGGDASLAVPAVDPAGRNTSTGEGTIAAGAGGVYLMNHLDSQASYPIYRYPGDGGPGELIARVLASEPELPVGAPFSLRLDGNDLYFLSAGQPGVVWDRGVSLMRVRQNAAVTIWSAASLGVPVFDESSIYVAYQRGGLTSPIEGVVARLPK